MFVQNLPAISAADQIIDRNLFFWDDFNKSLWTVTPWFLTLGVGASVALDATAGLVSSVGQTMKYNSGTTAAASSECHRYFAKSPYAHSTFFGGRFHVADSGNPTNIGIYCGFRDGVNWTRGKMLVTGAGVVSWQDSGNNLQQIVSRSLQASATRARWHTFYLQVNFTTARYERVIFDEFDVTATVSNQPLRVTADATVPNMIDFALDSTDTAVSGAIYYDELYGGWF